jgi:hypothetical protein
MRRRLLTAHEGVCATCPVAGDPRAAAGAVHSLQARHSAGHSAMDGLHSRALILGQRIRYAASGG